MLTGSTSNTSRHSETRQSQAGRSPGLARHLLGLPQDTLSKIIPPSIKTTLASDLFEKRSHETENLARDLQLCLLNRSILPEEREGFLLKALTQPNVDNAQSDFSSLLNPVFTERHPAPYLPRLLEVAAYGNKSIAFERVIETALQNDTPLPESTYEWVAECGKPEMLNKLLEKIQPALSEDRQQELEELAKAQEDRQQELEELAKAKEKRQEELKNLAQAQEKTIQRYREYTLPQRQQALHDAAQGIMRQRTVIENRRDVLALLQTPDIDVNAPNQLGSTSLHVAALNGRTEIVNALLGAPGIDVNAPNDGGLTPLHFAAQYGRTETVNALLGAPGIDVNAPNDRGLTPLHVAAQYGHTETVNALLGAPGINVNAANQFGNTALHFAAHYGRTETVNALLGAPGIDVNTVDDASSTALHFAALNGHTETVNALLQAPGIDVNTPNERGVTRGVTPLQAAVRRGHAEIVNALRQAGGI
jgi:ankyrin repeat protein